MPESQNQIDASTSISGLSQSRMRIPITPLANSLGLFLAITFVLCVVFDLAFPDLAMRDAWMKFLPGFTWISLPSFLLGLVESFVYGWYVALIFAPLFNLLAARQGTRVSLNDGDRR